ncbi:MAG: hypothetical protein MRECE_12c014 [Mycoplasmataceae bacterium CE_OT135]|nr:MAG: hypothetical protein MRECE_12c014 [Mycoplasmataceae bacterium CE_OT135]
MNKVEIKSHFYSKCKESNQSVESDKKTNYLSWILRGVGFLGLIGVVVYFLTKKGENK